MERMTHTFVVVARYPLTNDAIADMGAVDIAYTEDPVSAYDAAVITTDAWAQVHTQARQSATAMNLPETPLVKAFTTLFGGPFVAGVAPSIVSGDKRIPHAALDQIGRELPADAVALFVVAQAKRAHAIESLFSRSEGVAVRAVEPQTMNAEEFPSVLSELMHEAGRAVLEGDKATRIAKLPD